MVCRSTPGMSVPMGLANIDSGLDQVAAVVITVVNLFGGFIVGVVQRHESMTDAISTYSLLSVGDGLVSQIPALLISISTGLIVTRATTEHDMGSDLLYQFSRHRRAFQIAGTAILFLALIPGLPKLPFVLVGAVILVVAQRLPKQTDTHATTGTAGAGSPAAAPSPDTPEGISREMRVEPLELELAYDLIDLVDAATGGDLLDRVRALRRKLALELGIVTPLVRTRDNIELPPATYTIRLHGVEVARGEAPPGMLLAIADDLTSLPGKVTREPVFGLDAKWVPVEMRRHAGLSGVTLVDRSSVITTHLAEIVRKHAHQLLGREDVKSLVEMTKSSHPVVVEELTPNPLSLGEVQRCLQSLLAEGVCIRDLVRIFEAMSSRARTSTDPDGLLEAARGALGPAISAAHAVAGRLPVITFDPLMEQTLLESLRTGDSGAFLLLDPEYAERLAVEAARVAEGAEQTGDRPVLVCAQPLRLPVRRLVESAAPSLPVLSYSELGSQLSIHPVGAVDVAHAPAA